jgi:hypothetical protein
VDRIRIVIRAAKLTSKGKSPMRHNRTQWFSQATERQQKRVERAGKKGTDFEKNEEIGNFSSIDPEKMKMMIRGGGGGDWQTQQIYLLSSIKVKRKYTR